MEKNNNKEKISLLERARRLGKVCEVVPGFSFNSDSKIKLYEFCGTYSN